MSAVKHQPVPNLLEPRVIDLSEASGSRQEWGRPVWQVVLWTVVELVLVTNPWQPSSRLRRGALKAFGARIGQGVILRPRLRVKFPWKLAIGDRSWIGEDVWLHNQDQLTMGSDVVVSQGSFITTGTHDFRGDMSLITRPVVIEDGAWVTARCILLSGSHVHKSALVLPGTTVRGDVPTGSLYGGTPAAVVGERFSGSAVPRRLDDSPP